MRPVPQEKGVLLRADISISSTFLPTEMTAQRLARVEDRLRLSAENQTLGTGRMSAFREAMNDRKWHAPDLRKPRALRSDGEIS